MLPGSFAGGDVVELTTYAIVNGVARKADSFSSSRDLAGDLPAQVASGAGMSGGSGTIVWSPLADVDSREVSPWHKAAGWPPSSGDRVQVYVTDGLTAFPRFTGVIDATTGTVGGDMQSTVIDDRDKLSGTYSQPALLRHHVPYLEGGDYRSIGLDHWFTLVGALRAARVYNTPYAVAEIALSSPLQGSVWPEAGTLTDATGLIAGNHASFYQAPWGHAAGGFTINHIPRTTEPPASTLLMTILVAPDHAGLTTFDVVYGSYVVRVRVDSARGVQAFSDGVEVCRLTGTEMSGATTVTLLVKAGAWKLENDRRVSAAGTASPPVATAMSSVSVVADAGSRVAGVQVSKPASAAHEVAPLTFVPNMRFTDSNLATSMDMSPRVEGRSVAELVDEICKATLTAAWWDESGVLNFVPSDKLRGAASVQTITTLDDITDLAWEDSLLSVRSKVEVTWKDPSISKGKSQRKELFRGAGDTMEAQDIIEVFASPDDSTEWFGVDRSVTVLDDTNWGTYNRKRGSFAGVFYSDVNGNEIPTSGKTTTVTTESLGSVAIKINHVAGSYGTDVEANMKTSPSAQAMWAYLRDQSLPVVRGFGEGKWIDAVHVSATGGPIYAPALTHDLGYWGHEFFAGGSVAQRIADFIAGMVTAPTPTITGLGVIYDPRRQVGDVVTIVSGILDVTLTALIVGISESHAPGDHSQDLTVRIISVTSTRKVTYDELASAWAGGNYAGLQAAWSGLTYSDFTNEPLEGAPN